VKKEERKKEKKRERERERKLEGKDGVFYENSYENITVVKIASLRSIDRSTYSLILNTIFKTNDIINFIQNN